MGLVRYPVEKTVFDAAAARMNRDDQLKMKARGSAPKTHGFTRF